VDAASVWTAKASKTKAAPKASAEGVAHKDIDLSLRAPEPAKMKDTGAVVPGKTAATQAWSAVASSSEPPSK
jgi:hypothetical protein